MAFVTDDFTGSSGTNLTSHSANWKSDTSPTQRIELDGLGWAIRVASVDGAPRYWNEAVTPSSADYEVSAEIFWGSVSANFIGVTGRHSNSAATFYYGRGACNSATFQLYRVVSGSFTLLGSGSDSTTNALAKKTVTLRMEGTTIKVIVDGSEVISQSDSAIAPAGFPGLSSFLTGTGDKWNNFSASYLTAPSASLVPKSQARRFQHMMVR